MAKFFLINNVLVGTSRLFAGSEIDDAAQDTDAIKTAGGVLISSTNTTVAAAATKAQALRLRGGDPNKMTALMLAALGAALDGAEKTTFENGIKTDTIEENILDAGVTADGVLLKDGAPNVDTVVELTADAGVTVDGAKIRDGKYQQPARGTNLTDADATIELDAGNWRRLVSAISANRVLTLGVAGTSPPQAGEEITITRLDGAAFTYQVDNGGAGAGTLATFASAVNGSIKAQFDGADWLVKEFGTFT